MRAWRAPSRRRFPTRPRRSRSWSRMHLTEARQERAAIAWWVRGGTRARQRAAYAGAIEQLRRGLDSPARGAAARTRARPHRARHQGVARHQPAGDARVRRARGRRDPRPRARAVPDGGGRLAAARRARRPLPLLLLPERFPVGAGDGRAAPAGDRDHRRAQSAVRELLGPRLHGVPGRRARGGARPLRAIDRARSTRIRGRRARRSRRTISAWPRSRCSR